MFHVLLSKSNQIHTEIIMTVLIIDIGSDIIYNPNVWIIGQGNWQVFDIKNALNIKFEPMHGFLMGF